MLPPPSQIKASNRLKKALGSLSIEPLPTTHPSFSPAPLPGDPPLNYHDLYHLEVSRLGRIQIGKHWVSGIHGINSPVFHPGPIVEEYAAYFDEARVAIHEWITHPSLFNTLKWILWSSWLILHGINPWAVLIRHRRSLR